jgi:hypothetical protein
MKEFADLVIEEGAPFNYKWYVRQLRHVSCSLSCLLFAVHCCMVDTDSFTAVALHTLCTVVCAVYGALWYGAWQVAGILHALHCDNAA